MKIGVTGHQVIPVEAKTFVDQGVRKLLRTLSAFTGVSSLAGGADQLFAHAVLELGGGLHAVVPSHSYETTFSSSVNLLSYRQLLERATTVETLPYSNPCEEAFLAAGQRVVDLADEMIAIWDGEEARGVGGTADIVRYAKEKGVHVSIVWPAGVKRDS